jgi:Ca-activated chloride channel family protein
MKKIKTFSLAITMLSFLATFSQEKTVSETVSSDFENKDRIENSKAIDTIRPNTQLSEKDNQKPKIAFRCGLSSDSKPLYVVDGIPTSEAIIKTISPNNFESFNVLKGLAATALYGSKAANGVIIIKTKNLSKKELKKLKKASIDYYKSQENNALVRY